MKKNVKKHESSTTAHTFGADEKGTDTEDESEDEEEITKDEPNNPEPAGKGLERDNNAYTQINETLHDRGVMHAKSAMSDIYLAKGEGSSEVGNYPLTTRDGVAAIVLKRTGLEDSRSLAETLHQLRGAQASASKGCESGRSMGNARAVLGKRKKDLEKLGSSHKSGGGVTGMGDRVKDVGNWSPSKGTGPRTIRGRW